MIHPPKPPSPPRHSQSTFVNLPPVVDSLRTGRVMGVVHYYNPLSQGNVVNSAFDSNGVGPVYMRLQGSKVKNCIARGIDQWWQHFWPMFITYGIFFLQIANQSATFYRTVYFLRA